jgi:hypothetical protein
VAFSRGSGSYRRTPGSAGTLGSVDRTNAVRIIGLNELRKGLKKLDPELSKEINRFLKIHARKVAAKAQSRAPISPGPKKVNGIPVSPGALRKSIKPYARAKSFGLWSRSEYAKAHEWGTSRGANSQVRPRGVPIRIKRTQMLGSAVFRYREETEEELANMLLHLAKQNGFDD